MGVEEGVQSEAFAVRGNLVDVVEGRIFPAQVTISQGRIASIAPVAGDPGVYLTPGLVDSHVHVESSMLEPCEFARAALAHGTLGAVCDPHEIANVLGVEGVLFMLGRARSSPFRFSFGAPSCVPATPFETSGAALGADQVRSLLERDDITHLSEVMNYPGVVAGDVGLLEMMSAAKRLGKPIDGHAPGLSGQDLATYVSRGITTDHEVTSLGEAMEKISLGMRILVREGSAAKDFQALHRLIERHGPMCMFCSDDIHPDDLVRGHIDSLVRRAVRMGHDPVQVLRCASLNPVRHYRMDLGLLRLGDHADFLVVRDLQEFRVERAYLRGRLVAQGGAALVGRDRPEPVNRFKARRISSPDIEVPARGGRMLVIEAEDGSLVTGRAVVKPRVESGLVRSDPVGDVLKIVVVNRYRDQAPAVAFARGFGLASGAIASSVAHDSHNIVAVGVQDEDICAAVDAVMGGGGGIALAAGGRVEYLGLPVAGLMSDLDAQEVAGRYARLNDMAGSLGSPLASPFITLSFMALLVIPSLKLSDRGLFDSERFAFTSLWDA